MYSLNDLFEQLGLASSDAAIVEFIKTHNQLDTSILLSEAPFWTPSQAAFLAEGILNDADWAEVIDQLNVLIHATKGS